MEKKILIEVNDLSHSYGRHGGKSGKKVLDHITFQVEKGRVIGLLGPSGAGKTTLVNILTNQLKPTGGTVKIAGEEKYGSGRREVRKREKQGRAAEGKSSPAVRENALVTGIMMDSFGLYERLTVWDNMKIFAKIYGVSEERIKELLEKAELKRAEKTMVNKLSKGMRNRVNFCRALLQKADILCLDEPTSGLDPATTEKIHELIMEEKNAGTTVFLTTHNMHEAELLCDYILLLNEGKIVEHGSPEEICRKYNSLNKIEIVLKNGEIHSIPNGKESAAVLAEWMDAEEILSMHSSEPDLEKVFLLLTGRKLDGSEGNYES